MEQDEIRIGPIPEKYLDLRPQDTYDENIDALDALIDGEYDKIGQTYQDLHPRVAHSAFSEFYRQEQGPAKVDSEAIEQMQEILEENSGKDYFWPEEKLFNLGYRLGPKGTRSPTSRRNEMKKPHIAHGRDMIPDFGNPKLESPIRRGRKKREADDYYGKANFRMSFDVGNFDIDIV